MEAFEDVSSFDILLYMNMKNKYRLTAIVAFILGLLSIVEGGSVLLGLTTKPYTVLPWLVWYNVVLGFVSVAAGVGLWMKRTWGLSFAVTIVSLNFLVLVILVILYSFRQPVALHSIAAMLVRSLVWAGILLVLQRGRDGDNK